MKIFLAGPIDVKILLLNASALRFLTSLKRDLYKATNRSIF